MALYVTWRYTCMALYVCTYVYSRRTFNRYSFKQIRNRIENDDGGVQGYGKVYYVTFFIHLKCALMDYQKRVPNKQLVLLQSSTRHTRRLSWAKFGALNRARWHTLPRTPSNEYLPLVNKVPQRTQPRNISITVELLLCRVYVGNDVRC